MKAYGHLTLGVLALLLASTSTLNAQTVADAAQTLERARHAELVEGDLSRAMTLYRQVAQSATASRAEVAGALVSLGSKLEVVGSTEAASIYRKVVSEFSDQPKAFLHATNRLRTLAAENPTLEILSPVARQNYTLLQQRMGGYNINAPRHFDISPDGSRLVVYAKANDERKARFPQLKEELYLVDVQGTTRRPVVENAEDWEFFGRPRWSPDGRQILFLAQGNRSEGREAAYKLYDVATENIVHVNDAVAGRDHVWLPDGRHFVVQYRGAIRVYGLDGEIVREFSHTFDSLTRLGNVSPDGRYLLYQTRTSLEAANLETDIWTFDLTTGETNGITAMEGFEGWPVWSSDGQSVYFVSGTEAVRNVFKLEIGAAEPPTQVTSYSNAIVAYPVLCCAGEKIVFLLQRDNPTVFIADPLDIAAARSLTRGGSPELSPDGNTVYYVDFEPGRQGIWAISSDGSNPEQLVSGRIATSYASQRMLSPDGSSLAFFKWEGQATNLYVKLVSSDTPARKLYSISGVQELIPSWSPDSKEIVFVDGSDLYVIKASGGPPEKIASGRGWEGWNVEWSPVDNQIAVFGYTEEDKQNVLFVIDRTSGNVRRLTPPEEHRYKEILKWHPDGDRISYMYYNPETKNGSRVVSLRTGEITTLVDMPDPMWDYVGVWGPDRRYYFSSVPRGYNDFWSVYSYDESNKEYNPVRRSNTRNIELPAWNADGTRMVWEEIETVRQLWMLSDFD